MRPFSRYSVSLLALLAGLGLAVAQQPQPTPQQQPAATDAQQKKSQETEAGKLGTDKPTAQAPGAKAQETGVLVNGALAVPGAPKETDTVPAKFSEKNAADDKLITTAYTFKNLTDEQWRAIYQALKGKTAGPAWNADVGIELPPTIEASAVPAEVTAKVPQTKGYHYLVTDKNVLLVSPTLRTVVGVVTQ